MSPSEERGWLSVRKYDSWNLLEIPLRGSCVISGNEGSEPSRFN